jgi:DNA repair protein RadA/Sms
MAKTKSVYVCQNCGAESAKWIGKCNACGEWNTYVEQRIHKGSSASGFSEKREYAVPASLNDLASSPLARLDLKNGEFNRVLGGGIVPGSLVLIGGEPGVGKSTLALQVALKIENRHALYFGGRKSAANQIEGGSPGRGKRELPGACRNEFAGHPGTGCAIENPGY